MARTARKRDLVVADNLEYLAGLPDRSVRVVYMDPPFCSGRDYESVFSRRSTPDDKASRRAFSDRWSWDDQAQVALTEAKQHLPDRLILLLGALLSDNADRAMAAYVLDIAPRLLEAHRVLRDDGTIYLHCDPTAAHYLKVVLDVIFGRDHFLNEIVWRRTHAHSSSRRYGPVHDVLLFYAKGNRHYWNTQYTAYSKEYIEKYYKKEDDTGRYQLITCTGPGDRIGTRAHYEWRGALPPPGRHWAWTREQMEDFQSRGLLVHSSNGVPRLKRYLHDGSGVVLQDVWDDIGRLDAHSAERVGFETQKPVALLERILLSSSEPGDLIVDPYCGSGTTMVAAEQLERSWAGIDNSAYAAGLALGRLRQEVGDAVIRISGLPASLQEASRLRHDEPLVFGVWAASMLGTVPTEQDLGGGIVAGVGRVQTKSRSLSLASWVPIRSDYDLPALPRRRLKGSIGLVLKLGRSMQAFATRVQEQGNLREVRVVALEQLVNSRAAERGCAADVW